MDKHHKNEILLYCNDVPDIQLSQFVKDGDISLEEFKLAGLNKDKIDQIDAILNIGKKVGEKGDLKREIIDKVLQKTVSADEIKTHINSEAITFKDLLEAGINNQTVNALKYYCNSNRITISRTVKELPPMEEGRTDVYFVGVPGSGKSTMLSGLLNVAHCEGILIPDTYNNDGSIYQTQLISDLTRGVLPKATASGSYNYVAMLLKDENNLRHPFNVVEVPGENYVNMFNNGDVSEFLNYINNRNKKILIFVIDTQAHDNGYNDSVSQHDQSLVYVNILDMFKTNGVLEQTDAIYIIANKFDAIKETRYPFDDREHVKLALEFLESNFKNLINNCKDARDESKNKFKIKVLPFSIGNVSYTSIIDKFNNEYSSKVINHLLLDSFVVKGGRWTKMFS